jgi:hypothetical protein
MKAWRCSSTHSSTWLSMWVNNFMPPASSLTSKEPPRTHRTGGCIEVLQKIKIFRYCWESKRNSSVIQSTEWSLYRLRYPGCPYLSLRTKSVKFQKEIHAGFNSTLTLLLALPSSVNKSDQRPTSFPTSRS